MLGSLLSKIYLVEEPKPQVASEFDFYEFLKKKLTTEFVEPVPSLETVYRASGLSRICAREEFLRFSFKVKKTRVIGHELQMTFDIGHGFHHIVQNKWLSDILWGDWRCKECGKLFKECKKPSVCSCGSSDLEYQEMYFNDSELCLSGHPDGVIIDPSNGERYLLELKTVNSKSFDYLISQLRAPMSDHLDQMMIYMKFLELKSGYILYFDKERSNYVIYRVPFDQSRFEFLVGKIKTIKNSISNGVLPERTVCSNDSCARAKMCPVRELCFKM